MRLLRTGTAESRRLWQRIAIGLALAGFVAAALWIGLARIEAGADAERTAASGPVDRSLSGPDRRAPVVLPPGFPRGPAHRVTLVSGGAFGAVPRDVAPIARVDAAGSVRVIRGIPPRAQPGTAEPWDAGVVLPNARLIDLSPRARAALLEILRVWRGVPGRAVDPAVLRTLGVRFTPVELDELLRWRR